MINSKNLHLLSMSLPDPLDARALDINYIIKGILERASVSRVQEGTGDGFPPSEFFLHTASKLCSQGMLQVLPRLLLNKSANYSTTKPVASCTVADVLERSWIKILWRMLKPTILGIVLMPQMSSSALA